MLASKHLHKAPLVSFSCLRISRVVSPEAAQFTFPLAKPKGLALPTSSATFVVTCFLDDSHSVWNEMESQDKFKYIPLMPKDTGHL